MQVYITSCQDLLVPTVIQLHTRGNIRLMFFYANSLYALLQLEIFQRPLLMYHNL